MALGRQLVLYVGVFKWVFMSYFSKPDDMWAGRDSEKMEKEKNSYGAQMI